MFYFVAVPGIDPIFEIFIFIFLHDINHFLNVFFQQT